jgi:DcmR-like sensory protein
MAMQQSENPNDEQFVAGLSAATHVWRPGHDVQFYEDEAFLSEAVASFLAEGFRAGQPLIVIATAEHRKAFAQRMRARGVDPEDLVHGRDIMWLDAADTLAAFMEGDRPDPELFEATVGNVFEKIMANRKYAMVRAYGEMVDLLWRGGKSASAIAVEELWNGLAAKYAFSLLCAYSKESLLSDPHTDGIDSICRVHSRVLPGASFRQ